MFRFQDSTPPPKFINMGKLRRQGFSVLAPLAAVAALLALVFQRGQIDRLDLVALPIVAAVMLLSDLALRLNRIRLDAALSLTYWVCCAYLLLLFHHQFSSFVPQHQMLSEGVLWFPAMYVVAFLIWRVRQAAQVVGVTIGVTLLIAAAHIWPMWRGGVLSDRLLASLSQFFLSGILISLIQYVGASARRQYEEMRRLAFVDSLTGLPNRRAAQQMLERLDEGNLPYAAVMIDLDLFKQVNERHGHDEGDRVLTQSARLLGQHLAAPNLLARWGGEEFLMVLPDIDSAQAHLVAERARHTLAAQPFGVVGQVTATFGVADTPLEHTRPPAESDAAIRHERVLRRADLALRQAKVAGRDQVRVAPGEPIRQYDHQIGAASAEAPTADDQTIPLS
ncbi:GGDEF domain-containing protein [Deinococcus sp.]|uniref:GGDEF domain-containing protein n=1 Tax=Deinococcus sp. TaxID=47478 RepID=UPI003B592ABC